MLKMVFPNSDFQLDEYTLVEKPALYVFDKLGYNYIDVKS